MNAVRFQGNLLFVGNASLPMPYAVRDAFLLEGMIIVLLDPNAYLRDPSYGKNRRRGDRPLRNLLALSTEGKLLWEAEFPERADYYYRVSSRSPLTVLSFSSFRCEIDPQTGRILKRVCFK